MKVGDKVKGFECYAEVEDMYKYRGEIGVIKKISDYDVKVLFSDGDFWYYPIEEAINHLVIEEEAKTDSIVESVIKQFKQRSEAGINKYGTTLDRNDLTPLQWLTHLSEELQDATLYIEKLKQELK